MAPISMAYGTRSSNAAFTRFSRMEEGRSTFNILTSTPAGKRPLGRPSHRWEDNIRMDLKEIDINTGIGFIEGLL